MNTIIVLVFYISVAFLGGPATIRAADATNRDTLPSVGEYSPTNINLSSLFDHSAKVVNIESNNTDRIVCKLWINDGRNVVEGQKLPACIVLVANTTTNNYSFDNIPLEGSCEFKMFDSNRVEVPKTEEGRKYVFWSGKQIYDWGFEHIFDGFYIFKIPGGGEHQYFPGFSIPQVFHLTVPGEYTLHVRLRLVDGGRRDESEGIVYSCFFPQEVVAKVHIRAEDISTTNSAPR